MHFVTGMHRSGTSFLSQALHALGADFGPHERLFASDIWNQSGYFESIDVVEINNRMILGPKAAVEYWLSAPESGFSRFRNSIISGKWKYLFRPGIAGINRRGQRYDAEITKLHETHQGLFVKDPRFCLTLDAWINRGPVESLIFTFRSPSSVAHSIKRREGMPLWLGYQQWLYHVRGFFAQLPLDAPLFMVDFDRFFDPNAVDAAFSDLIRFMDQEVSEKRLETLRQTLKLRLRNHALPLESGPAAIVAAYEGARALRAACKDGRPVCLGDHPRLRAQILGQ